MFETKRCIIKNVCTRDAGEIKALYMNKDVRKYLGGVLEEDAIQAVIERVFHSSETLFYWVVREKNTDRFMGTVCLDPHHEGNDLELSYQFLPKWWGKGYATEALPFIINYAFDELKLSKLVSETQTANSSSCRLLEKSGMTVERVITRFGAEQAIYSIKSV
ncbi:GNAT family N-acetyltransferase [Jeotgalibacillus campisalis]|uniref:N-acetyltransferase domain-containing protein n=1 Tax=Jeotgalibacillus campisalis TaxID=220754 RepID=A0A0C2VXG2_9BACL|nr:GNAT family N-acetyltransferase [Jeotgalibacillus campisalis]KIL49106.1 hypothetical protein KR50_11410 [Jeotgalibacillus campisalis]